jgi:hypothetical protein
MIRRREKPDGLPYRVYERFGTYRYSIGYKQDDGTWAFRLRCPIADTKRIAELRAEATSRAAALNLGTPADGSFAALVKAWFEWQEKLPDTVAAKRAERTIAENKREAAMLLKAWGTWPADQIEKSDGYDYLDACLIAKDKAGNARPRPEKGNKEIALARLIFEYGVRTRRLKVNPFIGIEKLVTEKADRYVTDQELALAVEVGRRMGGPQHICALALKTAFLCVRRSFETRGLTRPQIKDEGIEWYAAKRRKGDARKVGLIEWSPELRATIDEALAIERYEVAGNWFVFGNMSGQRYTKGGWKATLAKLMTECEAESARRKLAFVKFSLQDCRPKGVSDKLARGDDDTQDATMHSNRRMIEQVYDRRRVRVAKPAK